jgi:hypothetical protein
MKVEINFLVNGIALKKFDGNKIYMEDKAIFEIEFFNKDSRTVCPSIIMNGDKFKRMPVVHPGQKYRLDDFIDINRKFLFSTYKVEDTPEVNEIIKKNGLIEITYYYEKTISKETDFSIMFNDSPRLIETYNDYSPHLLENDSLEDFDLSPKLVETGRIMKGEKSNTKYTNVSIDIDWDNTEYAEFKILPISYMPKDICCPKCNKEYKEVSFNYCPNCGEIINLKL